MAKKKKFEKSSDVDRWSKENWSPANDDWLKTVFTGRTPVLYPFRLAVLGVSGLAKVVGKTIAAPFRQNPRTRIFGSEDSENVKYISNKDYVPNRKYSPDNQKDYLSDRKAA